MRAVRRGEAWPLTGVMCSGDPAVKQGDSLDGSDLRFVVLLCNTSQGSYYYPDGSYYTGAWKAGKKHGVGTFWDTTGGCLHGMWEKGSLQGDGRYDQPNYHFEGKFVKSVPAGEVMGRRGWAGCLEHGMFTTSRVQHFH